jgi:hypothetical protein
MIYLIFGLLALALLRNIKDYDRLIVTATVGFITALSYTLYYSQAYYWITDLFGYWGYMVIEPTAMIMALYFLKSRISTVLMLLFVLVNLTNLVCFFWEKVSDVSFYDYLLWGFFFVEIAILLSERVTDAVFNVYYRIFHPSHLDRVPAYHMLKNCIR